MRRWVAELVSGVTDYSPNHLAAQLESDREQIAALQERVRHLVARRANKVPEKKKEAEELQRGVETLAHATAVVDMKKSSESTERVSLRAGGRNNSRDA